MLGHTITRLRKQRKLSQTALAQLAGVTQSYISQLESDTKSNVTTDVLARLAKALGVTISELLK